VRHRPLRAYQWMRARLGRRGLALVAFSLVFALTGLAALLEPAQDQGRFILYMSLPVPARVVLWLAPAALGLWAAFRGVGRDAVGFAALVVPASIVAFSYVWSMVFFFVGLTDYGLGWTGAGRWLLILTLLLIVSGWKEADEPPPLPHLDEGSPRA